MIDDMTARQIGPKTQKDYIRSCKLFTVFLRRAPDTATADDIRRFQLDLAESAPSIFTRNSIVSGLKFLFKVTLRRLDLVAEFYYVRQPATIPPVLNADEVEQRRTAAKSLRVRVMLSLAYGCGQLTQHHPHRAGQGPQGPACQAATLRAGTVAGSVGQSGRRAGTPAWRRKTVGCFRAWPPASRSRHGSSIGCSMKRPEQPVSPSG
jgi:hypothetical protein